MSGSKLKIAFLIGDESLDRAADIAKACEVPTVQPVAVLVDTGIPSRQQRWRNLKRNIRREGLSYFYFRAISLARAWLEDRASRIIPQEEVELLVRAAFPDEGLEAVSAKYGFPVYRVGDLNSPEACRQLKAVDADLGVVLGTRVLRRPLFSIPRMGCINLHKGKVPEYRGMPPGFWELYEGEQSAGVTVHYVDDGLDTGDVVGTSSVTIHPKETPESLRAKLNAGGARLLASVLSQIANGTAERHAQPINDRRPRTRPTRAEQDELARRLPHWRRFSDSREAAKNALWLLMFHSRLLALLRFARRRKSRGAILLYHRVNDFSQDVLTCSRRRFAEHLVALRHYYHVMPTQQMVDLLSSGTLIPPTSVAVHFDDCYRDVRTCAAPLLSAAQVPATAFVSSGFVDTDREFAHDREKYPHRFDNLRQSDLKDLPRLGVEVAAHTVNHVDLGSVSLEQAAAEVIDSRQQLEAYMGRPVLLFSFPFGGLHNIRGEVREMVKRAGYRALFSAHGGMVDQTTPLFEIPRIGVSTDHSPLALLMELEGLSSQHLRYWLRSRKSRRV